MFTILEEREMGENLSSESHEIIIPVLANDRKKNPQKPNKLENTTQQYVFLLVDSWVSFAFLTYQYSGFWIFAIKVSHSNYFITFSKSKVVWIESSSYYNLKSVKYFVKHCRFIFNFLKRDTLPT